jgi:hypothetical protein
LNGTNTKLIEKALGSDETDDWLGQQIVLFNDENVEYMGEVVGGVRCDVNRTKRRRQKALESAPAGTKTVKSAKFEEDEPPF